MDNGIQKVGSNHIKTNYQRFLKLAFIWRSFQTSILNTGYNFHLCAVLYSLFWRSSNTASMSAGLVTVVTAAACLSSWILQTQNISCLPPARPRMGSQARGTRCITRGTWIQKTQQHFYSPSEVVAVTMTRRGAGASTSQDCQEAGTVDGSGGCQDEGWGRSVLSPQSHIFHHCFEEPTFTRGSSKKSAAKFRRNVSSTTHHASEHYRW